MGRQAENLTYVSNIHLMRCRSEQSEEPQISGVETLRYAQGIMIGYTEQMNNMNY